MRINMYQLSNGNFLGHGDLGKSAPTHITIQQNGVWVSADESLYWSALPASASGASLSFQTIAITVPSKNKVGGISFDRGDNVYIVLQDGTGGTGKGSIEKYEVKSGTPPTVSKHETFVKISDDTPEFCLFVSDNHWQS